MNLERRTQLARRCFIVGARESDQAKIGMRLRIVRIQTEDRLELQRRIARPIGLQITLRSLIMRADFPRLRALGNATTGNSSTRERLRRPLCLDIA